MKSSIFTSIVACGVGAAAHGGIWSYKIDEVNYVGFEAHTPPINGQKNLIQRRWNYLPIYDPLSPYMSCNDNGTTLPGSLHAPIKAGGNITAHWDNDYWRTDLNAIFHVWIHYTGPMFVYLADCGGDCTAITDTSSLKWFKIVEAGLTGKDADHDAWEQAILYDDTNPKGWTITIPKSLKPGNYMIRHEIIYLNSIENDIQFYPSCAHLKITGDGTRTPSDDFLVKFPGAYHSSDPGLTPFLQTIPTAKKNGWSKIKYVMPGPKVWTA